MFKKSRSKRANQNVASQAPPTAAAAIAALQATGAQVAQDGKLAAGAAAAALRSHMSSPVNVGEVQTRRMIRRASITSDTSNTSYQHGQTRLSRSGSISSMTSRTFRSPSPHGFKPGPDGAPPVPAIPRYATASPSSMISRSFRRPASTDPTAARISSPTPQSGQRYSSVDTASRRKPAPITTANLATIERQNSGNRNSINFSRPMSPENRPLSPSPTSPLDAMTAPLSKAEAESLGYKYQEIANKPVKKRQDLGGDEGTRLAIGNMGIRATGTAVEPAPIPTTRPKRMPLPRRISEEPDEEEFEEVFDPHTRTMVKRRKAGAKPKGVMSPPRVASPTMSNQSRRATAAQQPSPVRSPARQQQSPPTVSVEASQQHKTRGVSASPVTKTRFALQPEDSVVHHEPARALTPTKSALRKSPSPRGLSPAETNSNRASWNQPGFNPSEASETNSHLSDDRPKRKSVRVSFDERPTIVGSSATPPTSVDSPLTMSPQHEKKKHWYSLRKNKAHHEDTEDDTMAPTPVLPSFGSVRGNRVAEDEQEPVREVLGIPGVAITTGEQTPSEAGSRVDDTEAKEPIALGKSAAEEVEPQVNGSVTKLHSGAVPTIAVIPGTPGVETHTENPLAAETEADMKNAEPSENFSSEESTAAAPISAAEQEAEASRQQAASEKLETDSQDSHYSDAAEDVDGDGFGSINAIVKSSDTDPNSPNKKLAESLPPLTSDAPPEIPPVAAAEADQGADAITFREAAAENVESPPAAPIAQKVEGSPSLSQGTPTATVEKQQKSPVESITYNPRRLGSRSPSRDNSPDAPKRFVDRMQSQRTRAERRWSIDSDEVEDRPVAQSSAYPVFEKSPRQSYQGDTGNTSPSPYEAISRQGAAGTPQKSFHSASKDTIPATDSASNTPSKAALQKKPLKSALKQTNRASMPPEPFPEAQPRGALQKKPRPVSVAASSAAPQQSQALMLAQAMVKVQERRAQEAKAQEADIKGIQQRARAASLGLGVGAAAAAASKRGSQVPPMPKPRRRGSDASDSSFRRGPSSVTSEGGRVSMRRSMRASPAARPQSMMAAAAPSSTLRATPSQRARPTSMVGGSAGGFGGRTLRPSREPSPTRSILSFRKSSRSASVKGGRSQRKGSRFDDDSDDEMPMPPSSKFESRRISMRPQRSVPARTEEVDSSDLDSDAEPRMPTLRQTSTQDDYLMELARQRLGIEARPDVPQMDNAEPEQRLGQSDLVAAFAEKKGKESKRKSFFGSLSRRKTQSKVTKSTEESVARKDTPLERNVLQRKTTGQDSQLSTPDRPRFSRQNTSERVAALKGQVDPNAWPLPEDSATAEQRPDTSDGSPPVTERPTPQRQISTESAPVFGRSGKKKRFPKLRRAFGLSN